MLGTMRTSAMLKGEFMNYQFLARTQLFSGNSEEEIKAMLKCLGAMEKFYGKGDVIYHEGDCITNMGMVLSGSVWMENDDLWGNTSILSHMEAGQLFGETYACLPGEPLMVRVVAAEPTHVLFLDAVRLMRVCRNTCGHHARLIRNLLMSSAEKNLNLSRRIFHTSPKTIRGRLLAYLSFQASRQNSREFTIPFNRQQLADYLSVDRSALSNELSKMQKEGLIEVERNHFRLRE